MNEIKLNMRYPESRLEDVTDAYMRGFEVGLAMRADENAELRKELAVTNPLFETLNDANDRLIYENMKLRELVRDMWHDARLLDANGHIDGMRLSDSKAEDYKRRMEELGVEV